MNGTYRLYRSGMILAAEEDNNGLTSSDLAAAVAVDDDDDAHILWACRSFSAVREALRLRTRPSAAADCFRGEAAKEEADEGGGVLVASISIAFNCMKARVFTTGML